MSNGQKTNFWLSLASAILHLFSSSRSSPDLTAPEPVEKFGPDSSQQPVETVSVRPIVVIDPVRGSENQEFSS